MNRARSLSLGVAACLVSIVWGAEPPRILIVQQREPVKEDVDPNVYVLDYLAQELDASGLGSAVVWGMGDPIFRTAVLDGTLAGVPEAPSLDQALGVASKLNAAYTIWIRGVREGANAKGTVKVFQGRREIWKDEKTLAVSIGGEHSDTDAGRSLARTWMILLSTKPFKGLVAMPKAQTPVIAQGQQPPTVTLPTRVDTPPATPTAKGPVDNSQLKKDVSGLILAKRRNEAILRLKDAVDQEPMDYERRTMLIEALMGHDAKLAADEARRASGLFPDKAELRILAARSWLRAGSSDEARQDLNEAIARDPNGISTRIMLAEISLEEGSSDKAIEHLDAVIKIEPSADAYYRRALCRSLLGGTEGVEQDLAECRKLEPQPDTDRVFRRYGLAVNALRGALKQASDDQRSLLQRALVRPKDDAVREELERLERQARSRAAFMTSIEVPAEMKASHERRLLGSRLLSQSLLDLQDFLDTGSEDSLTESRINLGEAIKHLNAADPAPRQP
ncbi:MAG TPA: tetratricopeptide repeat protein [Fimbriimonas sp.]